MNRKLVILVKMLALSLGLLAIFELTFGKHGEEKKSYTQYGFVMGTSANVSVYAKSNSDGIADEIIEAVQNLDTSCLSWRAEESALYKLNTAIGNARVGSETDGGTYPKSGSGQMKAELDDSTLYEVLLAACQICADSGGALDITIHPLIELWKIEDWDGLDFTAPTQEEIDSVKEKLGYEHLFISEDEKSIFFDSNDICIDLGAVGKGYALDVAEKILVKEKVSGATVSVGGSVLVYGTKPDGSDWKIGIRDPKGGQEDSIAYLSFPSGTKTCISTSGDYEKYAETADGKRYHHILDPKTGYPAETGLSSVTVVCDSGLASDGLSTACFVLGYEKSLPLLEKYHAEAVFVKKDNGIIVTDGLKEYYHSAD